MVTASHRRSDVKAGHKHAVVVLAQVGRQAKEDEQQAATAAFTNTANCVWANRYLLMTGEKKLLVTIHKKRNTELHKEI